MICLQRAARPRMCCAMTSPQHLVALPFPSCTEPRCLALPPSTGGAVAPPAHTGAGRVRQDDDDDDDDAPAVTRPLYPHLQGYMCSSCILLFICSCIVFGWMPEHVVVACFSVIDQRKSSQQNKEHVQTSHPPLLLVREPQTRGSG